MVALRGTYLIIPLLILSWTVVPILGLQSVRDTISSYGTIASSEPERELGVWDVTRVAAVPEETSWVVAISPDHGKPNLLKNPGFEFGDLGWNLAKPPDTIPMTVDILHGVVGNSVVMVSNELGYKAGLYQGFRDVPPNTTFHFKAMVKSVDIEDLRTHVLFVDIAVGGVWRESKEWGAIQGSRDWALYEVSFTTPDEIASVSVYPSLVYNRGEVWIDEASLTIEGWQPSTTPVILNWHEIHTAMPLNPFTTEAELEYVEKGLKTVPTENFWGILYINEEHYRCHVDFNDDVNTTWFGENLLGYPLYLAESPGATVDQWKDEMFLRMIRGFHNYFRPLTKVGITAGAGSAENIPFYFGEPAMDFIRENYDFVILYRYSDNLEKFVEITSQYFQLIDQLFTKQKKLLILTRIFSGRNEETWEPEAIALEMKNCFDRNIAVTCYYSSYPPIEEIWPLMLKAIELYNVRAPYYENRVYGRNLLTGYVGDTYGWVEVLG